MTFKQALQHRELRSAPPVLVKLTPTDRELLKKAARKYKMPMSTLAYHAIRKTLEEEFSQGGAQ